MAIADLNGDGAPDLVTVNSADDTVSVLLGNGTGTFAPAATYPIPTSSGAQFVAVAEVTGDGIPDIIVADTKKILRAFSRQRRRNFRFSHKLQHRPESGVDCSRRF